MNRSAILRAGDAYYFKSNQPHQFRNPGNEPCDLITACTPPTFWAATAIYHKRAICTGHALTNNGKVTPLPKFQQSRNPMGQFGTEFCDHIAIVRYENKAWQTPSIEPLKPLSLHPASHVLHYASTCFEGFKAYRWDDGKARYLSLERSRCPHAKERGVAAASGAGRGNVREMVKALVARHVSDIPLPPSSLYLRPTLIGTLANIGAAGAPSSEATLFVLASPVGDYFSAKAGALKLLVEDQRARTTEQLGSTKTGGNYAAALGPTLDAKEKYGVDQVSVLSARRRTGNGCLQFPADQRHRNYHQATGQQFPARHDARLDTQAGCGQLATR